MTQDIYNYLNDIQEDLKALSAELDNAINDPDLANDIANELDEKVMETLLQSIDWLGEILDNTNKTSDIDYYVDPYEDGEDN